jgi:hypothetical protein
MSLFDSAWHDAHALDQMFIVIMLGVFVTLAALIGGRYEEKDEEDD